MGGSPPSIDPVEQEKRRQNEFLYNVHLQRLLTFIVLGVTAFFAELQLSIIAQPLTHTLTEYRVLVLSTLILAGVAYWALVSALAEFHLATQIGERLGVGRDEWELAKDTRSIAGAALKLRFLSEKEMPRGPRDPPTAKMGTRAEFIAFFVGTMAIILPAVFVFT